MMLFCNGEGTVLLYFIDFRRQGISGGALAEKDILIDSVSARMPK